MRLPQARQKEIKKDLAERIGKKREFIPPPDTLRQFSCPSHLLSGELHPEAEDGRENHLTLKATPQCRRPRNSRT